jgi:UDP-GlcNAc:undecaprenyl-phosphate GlcNAc-1-phosphate transferase
MLTAFFISFITIIILRPVFINFELVDFPSNRKTHFGNVPLMGGVCVFLGVLISCLFFVNLDKLVASLLIASSLILIIGICDDLKNLKAKTKLFYQAIISLTLIYVTDTKLDSLGFLFGMQYPIELGILSIPVTVIAMVGLTNAINMIDGLDGLASSLVIIAIIGMVGFNTNLETSSLPKLLLAVAASSAAFMIFNIAPYSKLKIFLGDGGSLLLGFIISFALIEVSQNDNNFNPSFALWCVAIPLLDFFSVISIRLIQKHSLVIARNDHIHHILENQGLSRSKTLALLVFIGMILLLIGKFLEDNFSSLSFLVFIISFFFYLFIRLYIVVKKKL